MGCGASVESTGNMTSVAPGMTAVQKAQQKGKESGSEQAAITALTMKRKNNNMRGTKGYETEQEAPDMTPVDKSDDIRSRLTEALTNHWLFESSTSKQIDSIVNVMRPKSFKENENIITQGDAKAGEFFFIASGKCKVVVDGKTLEHTVVTNQCFGELALFYKCPRTATIAASGGSVETWILDQAVFRYALASRNEEMLEEHVTFLKKMPTFEDTPDRNLKKLAECMGRMTFGDGDYVVKQGDIGEVFYIVTKGAAKVIENNVEKEHTIKSGDWFGERSLITHEVRSASIVAVGSLECVAVSKQDFDTYFGSFESFRSMKKGKLNRTVSTMKSEQVEVRKMKLEELNLLTVLGVGGFGLVSLCQDKATKAAYALKKMQKERIVEAQMQDMIVNEKKFLSEMNSPFVLGLVATCQDRDSVYLLLEFLQGGDLFGLLEKLGTLSVAEAQFYMGCTVEALAYVHGRNIAFRDLKLENLVLDKAGYCKMVDFGLAKRVLSRTYTVCGSPRYCAPEIVTGRGHCHFVDWWALGVTMYECVFAISPFAGGDDDNLETFRKIANGKVTFPRGGGSKLQPAKDFIMGLLDKVPNNRLGCREGGVDEVRKHPFYKKFDWTLLQDLKMKPPHIPNIKSPLDAGEFGEVDIYEEHLEILPYNKANDEMAGWTDEF